MKQYSYLGSNVGVMRLDVIGSVFFDTADVGMINVLMNDNVATYEPDVVSYLESEISEGCVFIDVGANVGLHTIRAARIANRNIQIIAFEPNPKICSLLVRNIQINGMGSCVRAIQKAAYNQPGQFEFSYDSLNHRVGRLSTGYGATFDTKFTVEAVRLDNEVTSFNKPLVLKVDVEGGELAVFEGAQEILDRAAQTSIIFEINSAGDKNSLKPLEWLSAQGFSF